jgi:chromosome partitioning protein
MFRIALVNQKGGVGKSTTAVNLSAGLAKLGKRVLLIDLDPQGHATVAVGLDPRKLDATIYTLLSGTSTLKETIRPVSDGLSIIPANIHLAGGEAELASMPNPTAVLKRAMAELDESQFDYAIVDSPPQLGFLNVNSLAWVREVFIPVTCEFYALHGLSLLMETVERVKAKLNPLLRISGVVTCQVHPRRAITRDVLAELERHFPGRVLKTRIRVNVRLVEAPSHGKPIFDYAPESNGAADYLSLAQEVLALAPAESAPVEVATPVAEPAPAAPEPEPPPVVEHPYVKMEPDAPLTTPVAEPEVAMPVAEAAPVESAAAPEPEPSPVVEHPYVKMESDAPLTTPVAPEAVTPVAEPAPVESAAAPEPEPPPVVEHPYVKMEPDAPLTTPVAEPEADVVVPISQSDLPAVEAPAEEPARPSEPVAEAPVETPYVALPTGAPLTTPVGETPSNAAVSGSSSTYAQMLGLAGLKPIVVAKPAGSGVYPAPAKPKEAFGKRLFGKLLGRKD